MGSKDKIFYEIINAFLYPIRVCCFTGALLFFVFGFIELFDGGWLAAIALISLGFLCVSIVTLFREI